MNYALQWSIVGAIAAAVGAMAGCSAVPQAASTKAARAANANGGRIAQQGYGIRAAFRLCTMPDCPVVTRKTIDTEVAKPDSGNAAVSPAVSAASSGGDPPTSRPAVEPDNPPPKESIVRLTVFFRFGDAGLTRTARAALDDLLENTAIAARIVVTGRTDAIGPSQVNQTLARSRALAVSAYLRERRPDPATRIEVESAGACCYVTSNDKAPGRARNRRVEVAIYLDPEASL
ncbi:OmpA family protein [Cupriavidus basilensis]|uniref:OmpA family protein n=1 Tax=Cupriavidus basilensis TaxID=68895 RepID=A0ABT6B5A1_9BURK|nr:OmpA family protein [Cupriavidus basilensis]MDF3840053.1 OmpA family protein [Cupriavidus basilensis]